MPHRPTAAPPSTDHDVVIAGAGPVGLCLACELRLAGMSVLVVEQAPQPLTALKQPPFGIRGLSAPTIEAFYRRGMLDALLATQLSRRGPGTQGTAHFMQQQRQPGGHFAGIQFFIDDVDSTKWPYRLPTPAPSSLATTMQDVETILAARAAALGVEVQRGVGVEHVVQSDCAVTVHVGKRSVDARWLVGCDGGRSIVRKLGGFEFTGTDPEFTGYSVQVELQDADALPPGRHYTPTGMYTFQKPGTIAMVDFDGGKFHRTAPITPAHVQTVLRHVTGTDLTVTALTQGATWTDRAYQATQYRKGRVLLAGDAAHVHSPLGGQGLNLGLGDAMNLGWKLAATIRGDAPGDLLDSYASERLPVGARVLDWSRAQVALMRPTRSSRALEAIMRDLLDTRDGATYFAARVWGTTLRYEFGEAHPLAGLSAPDFEFADGSRLGGLLDSGKGLLLSFDAGASFANLSTGWEDRVSYVIADAKDRLGLSTLLVRPDGVVAWASDAAADPNEAARALTRWFGEPRNASAAT